LGFAYLGRAEPKYFPNAPRRATDSVSKVTPLATDINRLRADDNPYYTAIAHFTGGGSYSAHPLRVPTDIEGSNQLSIDGGVRWIMGSDLSRHFSSDGPNDWNYYY
jgi:hypothetical protein